MAAAAPAPAPPDGTVPADAPGTMGEAPVDRPPSKEPVVYNELRERQLRPSKESVSSDDPYSVRKPQIPVGMWGKQEEEKPPQYWACRKFLDVQFEPRINPLGIVIDWSLAFPVVAFVKEGTAASRMKELEPGLILVSIGKEMLKPGERREKVEELLQQRDPGRPFILRFARPCLTRFDIFGETAPHTKRRGLGGSKSSSAPMLPALGDSFLDRFPEKAPLSRFGDIEEPLRMPATMFVLPRTGASPIRPGVQFSDTLHRRAPTPQGTSMLPPVDHRAKSSNFSMAATWTKPYLDPQTRSAGRNSPLGGSLRKGVSALSTQSLGWLAAGHSRPDPCYEHIFEEVQPLGPGPAVRWPLHHEESYICRLSDFFKAECIRDAYEVGFRGMKREQATAAHITCMRGAPPRKKEVQPKIEEIICDLCGEELIDTKRNPDQRCLFYWCRRCKRNGHRYELCVACHAVEVLQGLGKHVGSELHPHWTYCRHSQLVKRQNLESAYPDKKHIRRAFCDYCGHLAAQREDDYEVFVCEQCPDNNQVRFELCSSCALELMRGGFAIARMRP